MLLPRLHWRHRDRCAIATDDGSKKALAFIAREEAVDVTGWFGGYNFQWRGPAEQRRVRRSNH
jgi:hypothetical protein